jgi:hypothetical protein
MQNLRPHPGDTESESEFEQEPQGIHVHTEVQKALSRPWVGQN